MKKLSPLLTLSLSLLAGVSVSAATIPSTRASDPTTVSNIDLAGWRLTTALNSAASGGLGFAPGPEPPPLGQGSFVMETGAGDPAFTGNHRAERTFPDGTTLDDLALSYATFIDGSTPADTLAPYLQLDVEYSVDGTPAHVPGTLVFEPEYQRSQRPTTNLAKDEWRSWTATDPGAAWWSSTPVPEVGTPAGECPQTYDSQAAACTWSELNVAHGDAVVKRLRVTVGDLHGVEPGVPGVGTPWNDFTGNIDAVTITDGGGTTTFDFEVAGAPPSGHDAFALGSGNRVWRFDLVNPATAQIPTTIGGFETNNETLAAIAFHPGGDLYGVTRDAAGVGRVYRIYEEAGDQFNTRVSTPAPFALPGAAVGASFDTTATGDHHLLHLTTEADVHVTVDVGSGAVVPLTPLAYVPDSGTPQVVDPQVVALAHAPGGGGRRLYGLDAGTKGLVELPDPAGPLATLGRLANVAMDTRIGFDAAANGTTWGSFGRAGATRAELYEIMRTPPSARHVTKIQGPTVATDLALPGTGTLGFFGDDDVTEGDVPVQVQVTRQGGDYGELVVDIADLAGAGGGTATPGGDASGGDYHFTDQSLVFPAGSAGSKPVTIDVRDDTIAGEGDETVVLELTDPRGLGNFIGSPRFTFTIHDSEAGEVRFAAAGATVGEGDGKAVLTVERVNGDGSPADVTLTEVGGGAKVGEDYADFDRTVHFPDGDATPNRVDVQVPIIDDTDFEGDEDVSFGLKNPTGHLRVGTPDTAKITIEDDPAGQVQFDPATYEVNEGGSRTVTVTRTGGNEGAVDIDVVDVPASQDPATPGEDYVPGLETHTFNGANGNARVSQNFEVNTNEDDDLEGDETIALSLSVTSGGATVSVGSAVVTILDVKPGTAFALTANNRLASFDPDNPAAASSNVPIKVPTDDQVVGIDFRPEDQKLYAVTTGNSQTRVYEVDPVSGDAERVQLGPISVGMLTVCLPTEGNPTCAPVPDPPVLPGQNFAVDWDPTLDVLRVVSDAGLQLVFEPGPVPAWSWRVAAPLAYAPADPAEGTDPDPGAGKPPHVVAVAHDQNVDPDFVEGEPRTTAFGIDHDRDTLVRLGSPKGDPLTPDLGVLFTVGGLDGDPAAQTDLTDGKGGLDITTDGRAYAVLTKDNISQLHTVDLDTGAATLVGTIGRGGPYTDVAFGPAGIVRFEVGNELIEGEGGEGVSIKVSRLGGSYGSVSVDFAAAPGTATEEDYSLTPGTIEFPDGKQDEEAAKTFSFDVTDDDVFETPDETFELVLSHLQGGAVFENVGAELRRTETLVDDPLGTVQFEEDQAFAAKEDTGSVTLSVQRVGGGEGPLSIDFITVETAGAATKNVDYTHSAGTVTFGDASEDDTLSFEVPLVEDHDEEEDERFKVTISNPQPATVDPVLVTRTVTIKNDDEAGIIDFIPGEFVGSEDSGGIPVTISRTDDNDGSVSDGSVSVDLETIQESGAHKATKNADYTHFDERVTLADGVASIIVTIPVLDDTAGPLLEGDETFRVELSNPTDIPGRNNELTGGQATVSAAVRIRDAEPGQALAVVNDTNDTNDGAQELVAMEVGRPDRITPLGDLKGLTAGESIAAMDFRPGTNDLFALALRADGESFAGRIYLLDTTTAAATAVGDVLQKAPSTPYPLGTSAGIDFDPVRDQLRLVEGTTNLHLEVDAAAKSVVLAEDDPLFYGAGVDDTPTIVGSAYTPAEGTRSTLYGIDSGVDKLVRQGTVGDPASADTGELTQIGALGTATSAQVGFDIDHLGRALATLSASPSALYSVNLSTGTASHVGDVGGGGAGRLHVHAFAAAPPAGALGFETASLSTGEGGDADRVESVPVQRTDGTFGSVTVNYHVADADGDPVGCAGAPASGTIAFGSGVETANVPVCVPGDDVYRDDLTHLIHLSDTTGGAELGATDASLTITDDDRPTVSITPAAVSKTEGDSGTSSTVLTVKLSNPTAKAAQVIVSTQDGAATAGEDFEALTGQVVTLGPKVDAAPSAPVPVAIFGDEAWEGDEAFTVGLTSPTNATLGSTSQATVTILNDDAQPTVSFADASVDLKVGESASGAVVIVQLSNPTAQAAQVKVSTQDDSALAGEDFEALTGQVVTLGPDVHQAPSAEVTIPLVDDPFDEDSERFLVSLNTAVNATLGSPDRATVTILDDDGPPTLSVSDVSIEEPDSGTTPVEFDMTLSEISEKTITVDVETVAESATDGIDFFGGVLDDAEIPPGFDGLTVTVEVAGDEVFEPNETFLLQLSDPVNAGIDDGVGVATILNDDPAPPPPPPPPPPAPPPPPPAAPLKVKVETFAPLRNHTTPTEKGYWVLGPGGAVQAFGDADAGVAAASSRVSTAPVVGLATHSSGQGLWLLDGVGGVHARGTAPYAGSIPERKRQGIPIGDADAVEIASSGGDGYVVLDEAGGVHAFGDAPYLGSIPERRRAGVPVGIAEPTSITYTPSGRGYFLLDEHGGVHGFGDARFAGSIPGLRAAGLTIPNVRFVDITVAPDGLGYWILDEHGGVYTFGSARFLGSLPSLRASGRLPGAMPATEIEAKSDGSGYWIFDEVGGVFAFGSADFLGSVPGSQRG